MKPWIALHQPRSGRCLTIRIYLCIEILNPIVAGSLVLDEDWLYVNGLSENTNALKMYLLG